MSWLRDVLVDLADDSPRADLAEQTIRRYERRRRTMVSLVAAAVVVVTALGATAAVRLLPREPDAASTVKDLPGRGVEPLSYAYRTYCNPATGSPPADCRDGEWRVVTTSGRTYHVPQASRSSRSFEEGIVDGPLAISQSGRKIAYYSAEASTFKVRDLASGKEVAAPTKIPQAWLYSIAHLLLSDDGRFLAFAKVPALKDPAMLIDMRERMVRPLPNGWNPVGLSPEGDTITLAKYSPKARLQTISRLWTTSTAGNGSTVDFSEGYSFSPLAPDGKTLVAVDDHGDPCARSKVVTMDAKSGKVLRAIPVRGLPLAAHNVSLRTWLSPDEVTVVVEPIPCPQSPPPDPGPDLGKFDPPYQTMTSYALDIRTGAARKLTTYKVQGTFDLVLPGPPGAI
jgi:hypothetical protein